MSLLDGLLGNASELDIDKAQEEFAPILAEEEQVEHAYKLRRDLALFTGLRLLLVEKQGMTGKKIAYHSFPYAKIAHYSVEAEGHFGRDAELVLWLAGMPDPVRLGFGSEDNIYELQRILTAYVA